MRSELEFGWGLGFGSWGLHSSLWPIFALNYKQLQLPIAAKQTKNKQKQDTAQKNVKIPKKIKTLIKYLVKKLSFYKPYMISINQFGKLSTIYGFC